MPAQQAKDKVAEKDDGTGGVDEVLGFVFGVRPLCHDWWPGLREDHL